MHQKIHLISNRRFAVSYIVTIAIFITLTGIAFQDGLLEVAESRLGSHMIFEHALFFIIGALSVMISEATLKVLNSRQSKRFREGQAGSGLGSGVLSLWKSGIRQVNTHGLLMLAIAIFLMGFWHVPVIFDRAVASENIHIAQHVSFAAVGAFGFVAIAVLGDSFRILLLIAIASMMGFSGLLFSVLDGQVYAHYSVDDHNEAGMYMIITSTALLVIGFPLYIIRKTISYVRAVSGKD